MSTEHIGQLIKAGFFIFVTIVIIMTIKKGVGLKVKEVGIELNLLTYGFLWETALKAINGDQYWPRYTENPFINKGLILLIIAAVNFWILSFNFRVSKKIIDCDLKNQKKEIARKLWLLNFLGCLSLSIFICLSIYWE